MIKPSIFVTIILLFSILLLWNSCFEEDERVEPHIQGNVEVNQAEMTQDYIYQIWFDLSTNQVAKKSLKTNWDMGFAASDSGWQVILNSSKFMTIAATGATNFSQVSNIEGLDFKFDPSTGSPDSTAVGEWIDVSKQPPVATGKVYVLNRGRDLNGDTLGYVKIIFEGLVNNQYSFKYADLYGHTENTRVVTKDSLLNFTAFSFDNNGKQINIEPPKKSWDLLFTQYTTMLYEGVTPYPYLVTGVLLNPNQVMAAVDSITPFNEINFQSIKGYTFTNRQDIIGYEWKKYDFDSGSYSVLYNISYIIKDVDGFYFKFRFTGFVNNKGEKGYPSFEFQKL